MRTRFVAAVTVGAALLLSPPTRAAEAAPSPRAPTTAADVCANAPRDQFMPEWQVRSVVESFLRYRVARIGVDGGCYSVLASDRNGRPFEVRFRGDNLRMVSRFAVNAAPVPTRSAGQ